MGGQGQPPDQEVDWAGPSPMALGFPICTVRGLADYLQLCPARKPGTTWGRQTGNGNVLALCLPAKLLPSLNL